MCWMIFVPSSLFIHSHSTFPQFQSWFHPTQSATFPWPLPCGTSFATLPGKRNHHIPSFQQKLRKHLASSRPRAAPSITSLVFSPGAATLGFAEWICHDLLEVDVTPGFGINWSHLLSASDAAQNLCAALEKAQYRDCKSSWPLTTQATNTAVGSKCEVSKRKTSCLQCKLTNRIQIIHFGVIDWQRWNLWLYTRFWILSASHQISTRFYVTWKKMQENWALYHSGEEFCKTQEVNAAFQFTPFGSIWIHLALGTNPNNSSSPSLRSSACLRVELKVHICIHLSASEAYLNTQDTSGTSGTSRKDLGCKQILSFPQGTNPLPLRILVKRCQGCQRIAKGDVD